MAYKRYGVVPMSIQLHVTLYELVEAAARERGVSKAALIREALISYLGIVTTVEEK